jgi:hypothetical protein
MELPEGDSSSGTEEAIQNLEALKTLLVIGLLVCFIEM